MKMKDKNKPMAQPYKVCPQCQQHLALHMARCGRCGKPQRMAVVPPVQNSHLSARAFASYPAAPLITPCVVCGCQQVQKVSAIVQAGTWTSTQQSQSVGYGHISGGGDFTTVGVAVTSGQGATGLAAILAAPVLPRKNTAYLTPVACGLALFGGLALSNYFTSFSSESGPDGTAFLLGLLLCLGAAPLFVFGKRERITLDREHDAIYTDWSRAMQDWETLLYCSRCDSVYLPHTRQAVPSRQMHGLIGF